VQPLTQSSTRATSGVDALASSFATSYAGVVAFMTVVAEGSFAKAGDRLGIGRSAVSRGVQKLESQLSTRLLSRTTRSVALTPEGELFHSRCQPGMAHLSHALEDLWDLRSGAPRGRLRVSASVGFGRKVVAPLLWDFQQKYPQIELELSLNDAPTDFTADHIDLAFRDGRMEDSQLVAKQVIPMQMWLCAAPEYVRSHGRPESIEELSDHRSIGFRHASGRLQEWEFKVDGQLRKVCPTPGVTFNDAELVLQAVLAGHGIAQMAGYQVSESLRNGSLLACMPQYAPEDRGHYICYLNRQHLPSRVRVFIDHMTTAIRALDHHLVESLRHAGH
jgi:DNA-binding transcriptional LysR family regulator